MTVAEKISPSLDLADIEKLLGADARPLLDHKAKGVPRESLHLPGPDWVDRIHGGSDRPTPVLRSLQAMFEHGRLSGTGYLSILPVDQGIEHSAGASFAKNAAYFDAENIVKLAIEGGCNAVASTLGVLGIVARKYAHRIPFMLKFNHNEFMSYPNRFDQIFFASIKQARDMGCVAVGATIYFGSPESSRQIIEVSQAFQAAHEMGLATVLWCYLRNPAFKKDKDYHVAADLTGQANHLGATLQGKGRLDEAMHGPSTLPFITTYMEGRGKPQSGPLDGGGRRSVYINARRNFLTPLLLAFDYPVTFTPIGRRGAATIPAQALTLMNDPLVVGEAARWADRTLAESGTSAEQRVEALYQTAFSRPPTADELASAIDFLQEQSLRHGGGSDDPRVWADLCHVLINVKEFIFIE